MVPIIALIREMRSSSHLNWLELHVFALYKLCEECPVHPEGIECIVRGLLLTPPEGQPYLSHRFCQATRNLFALRHAPSHIERLHIDPPTPEHPAFLRAP